MRVLAVALCVLCAQACVSVRSDHGYVLERGQTEIAAQPGFDTKESVLAKYGEPSMIGTFDRDSWFYLNSADQARAFLSAKVRRRYVIAIHFDETGAVAQQVEYDLSDAKNVKLVSRETPTRGKEVTFWEQLLGNVGQLPAGIGQDSSLPGGP